MTKPDYEPGQLILGELRIQNVKGIKAAAVTFDPDESLHVIGGDNGAGKSSLVDAIWYAIGGGKIQPERPIKDGAAEGVAIVVLNDRRTGKPNLKVTRKWYHAKNGNLKTTLECTDPDGVPVQGGAQTLLDRLYHHLIDPLEFMFLKDAAQAEVLRELTGLDFRALDEAEKTARAQRQAAHAPLERAKGHLASLTFHEDAPSELQKADDVLAEIEAAEKHNAQFSELDSRISRGKEKIAEFEEEGERINAEMKRLQERFDKLGATRKDALKLLDQLEAERRDLGEPADLTPLKDKLRNVESVNAKVRDNAAHTAAEKAFNEQQDAYDKLTARIEEIDAERKAKAAKASLPVDGLEIKDERVLLHGMPITQLSTSEQVMVSTRIMLAANRDKPFRLLIAHRSESLNRANMELIRQLAKEQGAQVVAERMTDDAGECSVFIEAGTVKSTGKRKAAAAQPAPAEPPPAAQEEPAAPETPTPAPATTPKGTPKNASIFDL